MATRQGRSTSSKRVWSTDCPHSDSTWPHSREVADEHFGKIRSEERRKIVYDAARLYNLE